jgi:hypothetical protein
MDVPAAETVSQDASDGGRFDASMAATRAVRPPA